MESDEFLERNRQSKKYFVRKRCLSFVTVILILMNMLKRSLQDELDELFRQFNDEPVARRVVTKSAFTQARKKLKHDAFVELNREQVTFFYNQFDHELWHGKRLVAVDGSMATLPNNQAVAEHFGVWRPHAGGTCPKARLSQLFDVLNKVSIDAIIAPKSQGERELATKHCEFLQENDLLLLDRGYPAFWLFTLILSKSADFCARISVSNWIVATEFVASGEKEAIVTIESSAVSKKKCLQMELPIEPMTVRLVRVDLPTGETEVLMTSLIDKQMFSYELFKDLYHHRWPVEEDYKCLKSRLEIENWSGKSVTAVYQDFHANVFSKNLAAILAQPAQKEVVEQTKAHKYLYQVNMTNLISKMKDAIVKLFTFNDPLPVLRGLWQQMTKTIEPVRPDRSVKRKFSVKPKRFRMNYKSTR